MESGPPFPRKMEGFTPDRPKRSSLENMAASTLSRLPRLAWLALLGLNLVGDAMALSPLNVNATLDSRLAEMASRLRQVSNQDPIWQLRSLLAPWVPLQTVRSSMKGHRRGPLRRRPGQREQKSGVVRSICNPEDRRVDHCGSLDFQQALASTICSQRLGKTSNGSSAR